MTIKRIYVVLWYLDTRLIADEPLGVRTTRFARRVEEADDYCAQVDRDRSSSLYLFIAPEYYFQKSSTNRYQDEEIKDTILRRLKDLAITRRRMMIVAGTLPWKRKKPHFASKKVPVRIDPRYEGISGEAKPKKELPFEGFNTAYVFYGEKSAQIYYQYHKARDASESLKADSDTEYRVDASLGLFAVDNLDFGIEVCLDHVDHTLASSTNNQVDVQLLVSQGTGHRFSNSSMANYPVKDGGYFIHCDGTSDYGGLNGVWRIMRGKGSHGTPQGISVTTPTAIEEHTILSLEARGYTILKGTFVRADGNTTFSYAETLGNAPSPFLLPGNVDKIDPLSADGKLSAELKVFDLPIGLPL